MRVSGLVGRRGWGLRTGFFVVPAYDVLGVGGVDEEGFLICDGVDCYDGMDVLGDWSA